MKKSFLRLWVFCWLIAAQLHAQSQATSSNSYTTYNIPSTRALLTSFFVSETGQAFVPVNGGIFMPKDSAWFMPPVPGNYITSFAPDLKDTALFVMVNDKDSSELFFLKNSAHGAIKRVSLERLSKGIYHVIVKNDMCYLWGVDGASSRIGVLTGERIHWIFQVKGLLRQVQVTDSSEIFFAMNEAIYKLDDRKILLQLETPVSGFCFDRSGSLFVNFENNVARVTRGKIMIVATGIAGLLECDANNIYVLSNKEQQLCILQMKE